MFCLGDKIGKRISPVFDLFDQLTLICFGPAARENRPELKAVWESEGGKDFLVRRIVQMGTKEEFSR